MCPSCMLLHRCNCKNKGFQTFKNQIAMSCCCIHMCCLMFPPSFSSGWSLIHVPAVQSWSQRFAEIHKLEWKMLTKRSFEMYERLFGSVIPMDLHHEHLFLCTRFEVLTLRQLHEWGGMFCVFWCILGIEIAQPQKHPRFFDDFGSGRRSIAIVLPLPGVWRPLAGTWP